MQTLKTFLDDLKTEVENNPEIKAYQYDTALVHLLNKDLSELKSQADVNASTTQILAIPMSDSTVDRETFKSMVAQTFREINRILEERAH